ncbi:glycosyltransferase family 4 protein [Paenibacillus thalictri]|uniref:Glycosyltransferase family 1 protein n=1 Tax=Paenibacillus thalictri TaxID=2527873 RepID=A0A4Q9DZ83_9BACL|nr:glycosyltransferase family 4 protein [Paenibacillus thalictri]TBL81746.1 glycosyltransferase family 1 protein [Paenibacillus thalictri]
MSKSTGRGTRKKKSRKSKKSSVKLRLKKKSRRKGSARKKSRLKKSSKFRKKSRSARRKTKRGKRLKRKLRRNRKAKWKHKSRRARRRKAPPAPPPPPLEPELPKGINLIGFSRAEIGLGESARLAARAIERSGMPFGIINYTTTVSNNDLSWAHKEMPDPIYRTNLIHLNPDALEGLRARLGEGAFHRRYNIGYWHWELPDMREEDVGGFQWVQEVWVPTHFVQQSFAKRSPVPVIRIPHGIEVDVDYSLNRDSFGLPHDRFLFLAMYDVMSDPRRKNPNAVIEAFKTAFNKDDQKVGLVLKVSHVDEQPEHLETLRQMIDGYSNIHIVDRVLSRPEVNALLHCSDCYVSLHRSEGFGLGLAEAMYLGKPVIGTNWSGNTDFMNEDNSCPVHYRLVQVGESGGSYFNQEHQLWAEADIGHAASYMRTLVNEPEWRHKIALNGQITIRTDYSPQAVGEKIKQRLATLGLW